MTERGPRAESISAVTLTVSEMRRSVGFYRQLGFEIRYGGADASFTSFSVGEGYLNLMIDGSEDEGRSNGWSGWGRVIFYVTDVDAFHRRALEAGLRPEAPPRDARWGERYFHLDDPDGHQLSFARPL